MTNNVKIQQYFGRSDATERRDGGTEQWTERPHEVFSPQHNHHTNC